MLRDNKLRFVSALSLMLTIVSFFTFPQPAIAAQSHCISNPELATCKDDHLTCSLEEPIFPEFYLTRQLQPSPSDKPQKRTPTSTPTPDTTQTIDNTQPIKENLNAELIFQLINEHRQHKGLPSFQQDGHLCQIASVRAPEVYNEIYVTKNMHAGLRNRELPYKINENIINMRNEQAAVNWWLNSSVHRRGIESNYTHSCVVCHGKSCVQLFSNLEPPVVPSVTPSAPQTEDSQILTSQLLNDPAPEYPSTSPIPPSAE